MADARAAVTAAERLASFWAEVVEVLGRDFNGSVVFHCSEGCIRKYEVHKVGRPRGGSVVL